MLSESLFDREFVADHVAGTDALRAALEPFTPEAVGRRADVDPGHLVDAARLTRRLGADSPSPGLGPTWLERAPCSNTSFSL
jgi:hypothetical protein